MFSFQVFGDNTNMHETDLNFLNKIIRWIDAMQKYLSTYRLYCSWKIRYP